MKKKMWVYFLQLSTNIWGDARTTPLTIPYNSEIYAPFHEEMLTEDDVWREVIDYLPARGFNTVLIDVADGMQYDSHPEISIRGAWPKEKLKRELAHMREIGLTPIPKLNFSTTHDVWLKEYSRMISTPTYYQVCEDLIKEVAEVFDYPALFHLGLNADQISPVRLMSRVRQGDLWWKDVFFLFGVCEKLGMRPWVWANPCWYKKEEYYTRMPKSVLQSNWTYYPYEFQRNPDSSFKDYKIQACVELDKHGFEQIPISGVTGRWPDPVENLVGCWKNTEAVMSLYQEFVEPERLLGHMVGVWDNLTTEAKYAFWNEAECFCSSRNRVLPEWL